MSFTESQAAYLEEFYDAIKSNELYRGIRYFSTQVSGPGSPDTITSDTIIRPVGGVAFWPGGFPESTESFAAFNIGSPPTSVDQEALDNVRSLVSASTIGAMALRRYESRALQDVELQTMKSRVGLSIVPRILEACRASDAPFACLLVGEVVASFDDNASPILSAVVYPGGIHPKTALAQLRKQLQ